MIFKLTLHLSRVRVACKPSPPAQRIPTVKSCRQPSCLPAGSGAAQCMEI